MDVRFVDRDLKCFDCGGVFVFTAGEQLFFSDKQFKNDPKRCKPCKAKRATLHGGVAQLAVMGNRPGGMLRLETRTECSACGVQTTVPFRPTQGRPVLCRECFQAKVHVEASSKPVLAGRRLTAQTGSAIGPAFGPASGEGLSAEEAVQVSSAVMHAAAHSSVSTAADLASIADVWPAIRVDEVVCTELVDVQDDEAAGHAESMAESMAGSMAESAEDVLV